MTKHSEDAAVRKSIGLDLALLDRKGELLTDLEAEPSSGPRSPILHVDRHCNN